MDVAGAAAAVDAMLAVAECWAASDDVRVRNNGAVLRAVVDARDRDEAVPAWTDPYGRRATDRSGFDDARKCS